MPIAVLLMPCKDNDLIASSRGGIILPQVWTLVGGLCAGVLAWSVNFGMAFARMVGWEAYLLYVCATVCLGLLPFFYRLPFWRIVAAVLLLMSAFIPYHVANFWR